MSPAEELRYLILGAQREGNRILADLLKPLDVTPAQAEVLATLSVVEPISLTDLGSRLVCETGSPSRLVDTLVRAGLVHRIDDPADRRRVTIGLTPRGETIARSAHNAEAALHEHIEHTLASEQIEQTLAALRRLIADGPAATAVDFKKAASTHTSRV